MKKFRVFLVLLIVFISCQQQENRNEQDLNFLFILADDLGWSDLSGYGSEFYETPNLDKLAEQGIKFTNAYAASNVCSPSRASILTGQYPARMNLTDWIAGLDYPYEKLSPPADWTKFLPHETITLAELLKNKNYKTISIGKWHLGKKEHYPTTHGFDEKIAGSESGGPGSYFYPYENEISDTPDLEDGEPGEYLTDRLTDEAIKFIEENKDDKFFMYLPYFNPHRPTQAKEEYIKRFQEKIIPGYHQQNPINAAMINILDENVGRLMEALQANNIAKNTVVVFFSDNGGNHYADEPQKTSNWPLREGKGSAYEGGVRVPLIVSWPGNIKDGRITDVPVTSTDFYPTIAELAGITLEGNDNLDGVSLVPLLTGQGEVKREAIYWHYPHYHHGGASPHSVIRKGNYKLIHFFDDDQVELYNLKNDIGETKDLSLDHPEKTEELLKQLEIWRKNVNAQLPTINPDFDPEKREEWKFHTKELW